MSKLPMTASLAHLDPPILLQLTHEMPNRNRHKKQDTPERVCRVLVAGTLLSKK
jgi:hypothetical protein